MNINNVVCYHMLFTYLNFSLKLSEQISKPVATGYVQISEDLLYLEFRACNSLFQACNIDIVSSLYCNVNAARHLRAAFVFQHAGTWGSLRLAPIIVRLIFGT